jgi:DNA (cytosine-5)-methyltransferase 1
MTIGSLFAGIGGLEFGLEAAGLGPTIWQVEREPFPRAVLAKHWPNADRSIIDVHDAGIATLPRVDLICGGFPCQDISYAGKGAGLAGERSGLWFQFARVDREMGPRFVVVENVAALATRGLDSVLGTLADLGYDARWIGLRASDVGAPHRRARVFIVAHARGLQSERDRGPADLGGTPRRAQGEEGERQRVRDAAGRGGTTLADGRGNGLAESTHHGQHMADAVRTGRGGRSEQDGDAEQAISEGAGRHDAHGCDVARARGGVEAQSRLGRDAHGVSAGLDGHRWPAPPGEAQREDEPARTVKETINRAARLKALGNAVVPQCAYVVGRIVLEWANAA